MCNLIFSIRLLLMFLMVLLTAQYTYAQYGKNDTLICPAIVWNGDTIEAKILPGVYVWKYDKKGKSKWDRLRNAVYVTYPYARKAGYIFRDIQKHMDAGKSKKDIRKYIRSREKDLRQDFTEPLTNLTVYQGKILMKLINRETGGTNCYEILKELKGGVTARLWQTVAYFFGSDLKQPYDAQGKDADIEKIVKEVQAMYGYTG